MKVKTILVSLVFFFIPVLSLQGIELPEGYSHEEALRVGEQMYRDGILPSGKPVEALVMGDIPFDGRMFTCDDCHQRSGIGSVEGSVITWPTNGRELLSPRRRTGAFRQPSTEDEKLNVRRTLPSYFKIEDVRPPYNDRTLAHVLRAGKDSAGRRLDPIMPKYRLGNDSMAIMIYYLNHLSAQLSPGTSDTVLHFATVIGEDVPEDKKRAMLDVLKTHIDTHNSGSRHEEKRSQSGPFFKSELHQSYRKLVLHTWALKGPEDTWREQLETYYNNQPVFALLGGITEGSWGVIHTFSEENKIPSILPITDLPVVSGTDWYTLYFSKGYSQEGETAAKYIRAKLGMDSALRIKQIYRRGDSKGAALSGAFAAAWEKMGGEITENLVLERKDTITDQMVNNLFDTDTPVVLLTWLGNNDAAAYTSLGRHASRAVMVVGSSTLLQNDFSVIPEELKEHLLLTYPRSLPGEGERSRFAVERWLQARKIPPNHFDIQARMYFLGWMLSGGIKSMRSELFRDYFLERFDMMIDQDYSIAVYPRLTFGPGQRYSSKGCYMVKLTPGQESELIPVSDWVIY